MITAEVLMGVGGFAAFALTLYWVRSRLLREKYAVAWMAVATLLLLAGIFPGTVMWFANATRLSYPSAVLFLALSAIYLFSMSVSLSLTRQRRTIVRLTQELALQQSTRSAMAERRRAA